MASGDPALDEAPPTPYGWMQQERAAVAPVNLNREDSSLATLNLPISALLELFPCAAALWRADRSECVFNGALKALLGYHENDFCTDRALWLECIDARDQETFLSSWRSLRAGQAKISCRYRFTPPGQLRIDVEETAMLVPVGPTGTFAVLSLYQARTGMRRARRNDAARRRLVHHMGNSLQAIRGEVDLLYLTGALSQPSFDNIARGIEQLHDLLDEIAGSPSMEQSSLAHRRRDTPREETKI